MRHHLVVRFVPDDNGAAIPYQEGHERSQRKCEGPALPHDRQSTRPDDLRRAPSITSECPDSRGYIQLEAR
eukprot:scaffold878_cov271-Pinguiococcus_pyrenoidosus.AAC.39